MHQSFDSLCIVIVGRELSECTASIESIQALHQEKDLDLEILIAEGNNPSEQRNEGVRASHKRWVLFLDNDSVVDPFLLEYYALALKEFPDAKILGGPSVLEPESSGTLDFAIQAVFSSDFGIGPLKSRYFPFGKVRRSSERELILCNFLIDRELFLSLGGFHQNLYPNEENEFLNRASSQHIPVYCPQAVVRRRHRETLPKMMNQMIRYGEGRVKHYRLRPEFFDAVFLLPLFFVLFTLCTPLFFIFGRVWIIALVWGVYWTLVGFQSFLSAAYVGRKNVFGAALVSFFLCHLGYGLGLIYGFFQNDARDAPLHVTVHRIDRADPHPI